MKELSIEEKATRYDEALIRGSQLWESGIITKESYEYIFPELAEREEEYKRWFINLVKGHIEWLKDRINEQLSNGLIYQGELNKALEVLAWLEKQGEYINFRNTAKVGDRITKSEEGVLVNLSQFQRVAKKDEKKELEDNLNKALEKETPES